MGRSQFESIDRTGVVAGFLGRYKSLERLAIDFEGFELADGIKSAVETLVIDTACQNRVGVGIPFQRGIEIPGEQGCQERIAAGPGRADNVGNRCGIGIISRVESPAIAETGRIGTGKRTEHGQSRLNMRRDVRNKIKAWQIFGIGAVCTDRNKRLRIVLDKPEPATNQRSRDQRASETI